MSKRPYFIPGRPAAIRRPLSHYRPQQPVGAAEEYVRDLTGPDGLVVDLFCQGPRLVREILRAGRRALGFSVNPLLLHAARVGLAHLDDQALSAAFTHLADSPKGERTLRSHLTSLYRTRCPVCHSPGTADWFAWQRDLDRPFEKAVRCERCGGVQVGPTTQEDVALAQSFAPRGLPFYYALDRAVPLDHPARERAAELVACYTPRNLSALMDLSRRVGSTKPASGARAALMAALIDCFDRCSKLYPHGEDRPRPRTLRIPVRYLERNVWTCFEEGLTYLEEDRPSSPVAETEDIDGLIRGTQEGYALVAGAARDVGEILPPDSVDLVLADPPIPDGVFWALSALWSAWLWDSVEARAMRPFLRRRRFDWHWHWPVLREALRAIGPQISGEGLLLMLFAASDREMLQSVCLAATGAGYRLRTWGFAPETGYRLAWTWEGTEQVESGSVEDLERQVIAEVEAAAVATLRQRGEPSSAPLLHAAAHAHLADRHLLRPITALEHEIPAMSFLTDAVRRGFEAAPVTEMAEGTRGRRELWWLLRPQDAVDTLADHVEVTLRRLLAERPFWQERDLINAVYARFPDALTPDLTLVRVCAASYGIQEGQQIRLRSEDDFERRRLEIDAVREDLIALGQRLGFRTAVDGAWDVRWLEGEEEVYAFALSATAALASPLLGNRLPAGEAQRCLVVPGGRAQLIDLRLQRDPRLARAVDADGWQFIKFRHLRRLMAEEDLDQYAFKVVLGLDPIAEREHTQLLLF